ncbi:MAG: DEAD/DEAH box helicase [Gammaproteobacteria bacterium]|nr:DEAD/DEAH box helicase [Gammaproteobacteria bacterium]
MPDTDLSFASFAFPPALLTALNEVGYETPSPIQAAAIPVLLNGQDLIGQAQTGTGKTAAFALPILARLDFSQRAPQVLVLTPTRELAIQVAAAFQSYARHLPGFHVLPIYGGQSMYQQLRSLQRPVHVVVGTPGRVMDHLRRESLSLASLRALVLDEADEMLRMGFLEEVTFILEHTPETRQTALFSATMPEPIRQVAQRYLRDPAEIRIKAKTSTVEAIRQRYWPVGGMHKFDALTRILEAEDIDAVLVFVHTKTATVEIAEKLAARGYASAALNGDLNQAQREKTIEQLKNRQIDVLIATDVAARGLDVPRISHVVNYDIPYDIEGYVHRIGRTGRAGRTGKAILFVAPREIRMLRAIERATRQPIEPMRAPTRAAIAEKRIGQFKQTVFDAIASEDLEFFGSLVDEMAEERGVDQRDLAAALAWLVQRDRPLQTEPGQDDRPPRPTASDEPRGRFPPRERAAQEPVRERPRYEDTPPPRERAPQARPERPARVPEDVEMVRYRLDVGHAQGATAKHIVGAIANEAGIDSQYIGRIDIYDDFSTVDLPEGMPRELLQHLKKVRFGKHKFNLTAMSQPQIKGLAELSAESVKQLRGSPKPRRKRP